MTKQLTHFDSQGQAYMVDVAQKNETRRIARAAGCIVMQPQTLQRIVEGDAKKGDVLGVARIAAIQASKRTAELIPLCHPIALTHVEVMFRINDSVAAGKCSIECERFSS